MSDIDAIERVIESSPIIVLILLAACGVLWKTLRQEMREWSQIAARNSEAVHALTIAVDRLRQKIDDAS